MVLDDYLSSFHVIERDCNNRILFTWSYPTLEEEIRKSILNNMTKFKFKYYYIYSATKWVYIYEDKSTLKGLSSFAICIIGHQLIPEKYEKLCTILWNKYNTLRSGPELVKIYLSVFLSSFSFKQNGNVSIFDFAAIKEQPTNIKDVIKHFNRDIIIVYVFLLLKKRIIIYHHDVTVLQKSLLTIIKFAARNDTKDFLRPFVDTLDDIKGKMHFVAGTINPGIIHDKNYDLLIDLTKYQLNIMPHAKEHLKLTDFHKKFAKNLCDMANDIEMTEENLVEEINKRTSQLRAELSSLTTVEITNGKKMLTMDDLRSKKLQINLENFLLNFAIAENMIML